MATIQKIKAQLDRLEERNNPVRNQAQGQRPQKRKYSSGDAPETDNVEPKPPDPSWTVPCSTPIGQKREVIKSCAYTSDTLVFSGLSRNSEVYLIWEMNMYKWLWSKKIPKDKRLTQAVQAFTQNAYQWWLKESTQQVLDWRDLKVRMYKEFVEKFQHHTGPNNYVLVTMKETKSLGPYMLCKPTPKPEHEGVQVKNKVSVILDNLVYKSSPTGMSHLSFSKNAKTDLEVQQKPTSTSLLEAKVLKEFCPRNKDILDPKEEETSSQGSKNESYMLTEVPKKEPHHKLSHEPPHKWKPKSEQWIVLMVRFILDQHVLNISMTRLMHLSCPTECETGLENQREYTAQRQNTSTMMLSVADQKLGQRDAETIAIQIQPKEGIKKREEPPNRDQKFQLHNTSCPKKKIIIQLVDAIKNVDIVSGYREESFKEIPSDNLLLLEESAPRMVRNEAMKILKDHQLKKIYKDHVQSIGVIISYLLKGEPSDTPPTPKPKQYQGYTVSRSKPCQEGGDVVVLKSVAQPESHQTFQTGHLGDTSDRGSVQGAYINSHKKFWHETNFNRRRTQIFITEA
ncbi:hypothetical protein DY000_02047347 [Brassica cretica]|uniref:Retrotransposon gag domain-containing protein n=1 Tax=Brassica cretica TaxID=69181 RepID=A0ABQ7EZJ1_BRACR|nr:hypothetical protein DY000_02047347 [Brassica cretica]